MTTENAVQAPLLQSQMAQLASNPLCWITDFRPLRNWLEWLTKFNSTFILEELLGLLHTGFNVPLEQHGHNEPEYSPTDRLIFYLGIADGWANYNLLSLRRDGNDKHRYGNNANGTPHMQSFAALRQLVAIKAFDMLCQHFFRSTEKRQSWEREEEDVVRWERRLFAQEKLFLAIMDFFRPENTTFDSTVTIRNLSSREKFFWGEISQNEKKAIAFLLEFAPFLWKWREKVPDWTIHDEKHIIAHKTYYSRVSSTVKAAQPWMIEILAHLDRLDVLEKRSILLRLNKPCLAKLEEIALRSEMPLDYRQPGKALQAKTVEEACLAGSKAALLLNRHSVVIKEHVRSNNLRRAEEKSKKTAENLERLRLG